MLTSARSADFWLRLCGARHLEGAEALVAAFVKAEAAGKVALQQHSYDHAKEQIRQVSCRCRRVGARLGMWTKISGSSVRCLMRDACKVPASLAAQCTKWMENTLPSTRSQLWEAFFPVLQRF